MRLKTGDGHDTLQVATPDLMLAPSEHEEQPAQFQQHRVEPAVPEAAVYTINSRDVLEMLMRSMVKLTDKPRELVSEGACSPEPSAASTEPDQQAELADRGDVHRHSCERWNGSDDEAKIQLHGQSLADSFNSPRKFSVRFTDNDGSQGVRGDDTVENVSQEEALFSIAHPHIIKRESTVCRPSEDMQNRQHSGSGTDQWDCAEKEAD